MTRAYLHACWRALNARARTRAASALIQQADFFHRLEFEQAQAEWVGNIETTRR